MKENQIITIGLPFIGGAALMLVLIYLVKLDGLILWIVFLIGVVIMLVITIEFIYPKIFENYNG